MRNAYPEVHSTQPDAPKDKSNPEDNGFTFLSCARVGASLCPGMQWWGEFYTLSKLFSLSFT